MKRLLIRLLAALRLVPAGRHRALRRMADQLKTESHSWKGKARQATARSEKLQAENKRLVQASERLQQQFGDYAAMQERLTVAERDLIAAREQLMAVDVKLDILEGAANVLDIRTRATISRQHSDTSASS
jgi:hypothetical protein